jgi:hypothetical protein
VAPRPSFGPSWLRCVFDHAYGLVPRPSLLGAIIAKAEAVGVDDAPEAQREDLAFLLSLVSDPVGMAAALDRKDRQRLRSRTEMDDPDNPAWQSLAAEATARGRAAYRLLTAEVQ